MIAVIADDFTGAAEMAGLGLRFGLNVEIDSNGIKGTDADMLIIATDTRSMSPEEAYEEVKRITRELMKSDVTWFYKKTDSVLRGHVLAELKAMLDASGRRKILLVPSNPAIGRKIKNGIYYINDQPVHTTGFAEDPEFSLKTSDVLSLLGTTDTLAGFILRKNEIFENDGVAVAEASSINDLDYWAEYINDKIIPAGASGFFASLLKSSGLKQIGKEKTNKINFGKNFLFICGSAFSHGRIAVEEARLKGAKVCEMPDDVFYGSSPNKRHFDDWVNDTISAFKNTSKVIVEINQPVIKEPGFAKRLRNETARFVENVMSRVEIDELFIDGGATVYSVAKRLQLEKLLPCQEIAPGVIRMCVKSKPDFHLTIKPGSYNWPEEIWKFD